MEKGSGPRARGEVREIGVDRLNQKGYERNFLYEGLGDQVHPAAGGSAVKVRKKEGMWGFGRSGHGEGSL